MVEPVTYKFRAFLSYSHRDTAFAKWLHAALESYRIDKELVGRATAVGPLPMISGSPVSRWWPSPSTIQAGGRARSARAGLPRRGRALPRPTALSATSPGMLGAIYLRPLWFGRLQIHRACCSSAAGSTMHAAGSSRSRASASTRCATNPGSPSIW